VSLRTGNSRHLRNRLRAFAFAIGLITALLVPSLYFYASYNSLDKTADTIASVAANRVSQLVFQQPKLWLFLGDRFSGILEVIREDIPYASRFEVFDNEGSLVAATPPIREYSLLVKDIAIGDLVSPVGRLFIYIDVLPIWIDTGLWLIFGVMLGGTSFYILQVFPMRELVKAEAKLTAMNRDLSVLVDERTKDLTQEIDVRKQAEKDLIHARDLAENASKAKSDFLSSMSHELRTPMNSILGFTQLIARAPDDSRLSEHRSRIDLILNNGDHLMSMIDQLLYMSRIEADDFDAGIKEIDLTHEIEECIKLSEPMIDNHNIRMIVENVAEPQLIVHADAKHLRQALMNLLSNAIKYNSNPGIVKVSNVFTEQDTVRISISDTGDGIPEIKLSNLFTPFDRLGHEGSTIQGSGLGLSITKKLIDNMGGRIGVNSKVGAGSQFWIELPIATNSQSLSA
jgi:signal transduction histidine kinase